MCGDITDTVVGDDAAIRIVAIGPIDALANTFARAVGVGFGAVGTQTLVGATIFVGIGRYQAWWAIHRHPASAHFDRDRMRWNVTDAVVGVDTTVWIVAVRPIDALAFALAGSVWLWLGPIRAQARVVASVAVGIGGDQAGSAFDRYLTTAFLDRDGVFRSIANAIARNHATIWVVAIRPVDTLPFAWRAFDTA